MGLTIQGLEVVSSGRQNRVEIDASGCVVVVVQCSSTCGPGEQVRAVVCRRTSADVPPCLPQDQPSDRRSCRARIPCYGTTGTA